MFLTDPTMREMFVYLVITLGAVILPALVLLSPLIISEIIDIWREL
jgi:hypothetical protein